MGSIDRENASCTGPRTWPQFQSFCFLPDFDLPPSSPSSAPYVTPVAAGTERTVLTNTGVTYHGEVLEYEPGDHVTLRLARGDIKHFPWKDVASATAVQAGKPPTAAAARAHPTDTT